MEAENNSRANGIQPLADTDTLDVIYVHIQLNTYIYIYITYDIICT